MDRLAARAELQLRLLAASLLDGSYSSLTWGGSEQFPGDELPAPVAELDAIANAFLVLGLVPAEVVLAVMRDLGLATWARSGGPTFVPLLDVPPATLRALLPDRARHVEGGFVGRPESVVGFPYRFQMGGVRLHGHWITRAPGRTFMRVHTCAEQHARPSWDFEGAGVTDETGAKYSLKWVRAPSGTVPAIPTHSLLLFDPPLPEGVRLLALTHPSLAESAPVECRATAGHRADRLEVGLEDAAGRYLERLRAAVADGCYGPPRTGLSTDPVGSVQHALSKLGVTPIAPQAAPGSVCSSVEENEEEPEPRSASRATSTAIGETAQGNPPTRGLARRLSRAGGWRKTDATCPVARPVGVTLELDRITVFVEGLTVSGGRGSFVVHVQGANAEPMLSALRHGSLHGCWPPFFRVLDGSGEDRTDLLVRFSDGAIQGEATMFVAARLDELRWPLRFEASTARETAWFDLDEETG